MNNFACFANSSKNFKKALLLLSVYGSVKEVLTVKLETFLMFRCLRHSSKEFFEAFW